MSNEAGAILMVPAGIVCLMVGCSRRGTDAGTVWMIIGGVILVLSIMPLLLWVYPDAFDGMITLN